MSTASIDWREGVPCSTEYNDIYYNDDGLAESRYVFLQQNQLPQRWVDHRADIFKIVETGFGTGLNFLACWQLWKTSLEASQKDNTTHTKRLQFISTELFPLGKSDIQSALAKFPELKEFSDALIAQYPMRLPGHHRIILANGSVVLDLLFGDAAESIASLELEKQIDCWFLDGFAPSQNPEMWNKQLWEEVAKASAPQATVATFTVAAVARHNLKEAGYTLKKVKGFGRKREMLTGVFNQMPPVEPPQLRPKKTPNNAKNIAVIGAGLAGCHTANALALKGHQVSVFDKNPSPALGASGNPQGILYTKLAIESASLNDYALACFAYATRFYLDSTETLEESSSKPLLTPCGVVQLMQGKKNLTILEKLAAIAHTEDLFICLSEKQLSELTGVPSNCPGILFPKAGYLTPPTVCADKLNHPNIQLACNHTVEDIEQEGEAWALRFTTNHTARFDAVIICNAEAATTFTQCEWLPIKPIRGQVTTLKCNALNTPLKQVLCHDGYIAPPYESANSQGQIETRITLGATFDMHNSSPVADAESDQKNLDSLNTAIPTLIKANSKVVDSRVGFRCTTPDYLPIIGAVPKRDELLKRFAPLRKNAKTKIEADIPYYEGLYLNIGHGSKGLMYTPLSAEIIAATISEEVPPLAKKLRRDIAPERFLLRDLIRNKI